MSKALVIMSGGQDSATCLFWALQEYDVVEAITFSYGQNHAVEVECAEKICKSLDVKQTVISLDFLDKLTESALISNGNVSEVNKLGLPSSFVPNRNQLFITLAHSYAQKTNCDALVTGVCQTDYSGYPDCRDEFIKKLEIVTNYGSNLINTTNYIDIVTPLMFLTKSATFKLAEKLGCLDVILKETITCYKGDVETENEWGRGCGECPSCQLRKKGYEQYKKG